MPTSRDTTVTTVTRPPLPRASLLKRTVVIGAPPRNRRPSYSLLYRSRYPFDLVVDNRYNRRSALGCWRGCIARGAGRGGQDGVVAGVDGRDQEAEVGGRAEA